MSEQLHTFVLSDIHLSDAELGVPGRSLWKRYKRPKFFIDQSFKRLIQYLDGYIQSEPAELILNGDIFDFDSVTRIPLHPSFHVSWLEQKRGLFSEEEKSRYKIEVILSDHPVFIETLRDFVLKGRQVVFVVGNHDIELHWPAVQEEIRNALNLDEEAQKRIRFCEWFYISNRDTTIEHGNQYDDYCVAVNPIHPLIKKGRSIHVRLPFGDITSRYMVNGMGLFNPHVESTFLMSLPEYFKFFYRYAIRIQPLLPLTWLWSASISFWMAMTDGLLPAMRDPLYIEQRVQEISEKANATPEMVRTLNELKVHSAIFNPIKIARELWLDRFLLLLLIGFVSFQLYALIYLLIPISALWFWLFFVLFTPALFYYSRDIKSDVVATMEEAFRSAPNIAKITKTKRVVFGHTHREANTAVGDVVVMNTGTWSPAFKDPECRESFGKKCFAWIRKKKPEDLERSSDLYAWNDPGLEEIEFKK